ncbi:FKBP-type peptidyl-prolyl cis-trans isomerase [Sphingomonas floccifaciens]|uniref:Peptidyl-prolyl cis-trans isomerase n=1 Tax=Sphingomonas floccifaciens TaxID=1844115 RepID=A0ABW4NB29_9SPHN
MSVTAVPIPPVKRRYVTYLVLGLLLAVVGAAALAWQAPTDFLTANARKSGVVTTASGLQYQVLKPGSGPKPTETDVALVNYVGKLTDGAVFDQSRQPTPLPVAGVVPGFSEAMKLMPKGAKYRVWIKPELGYGDKQAGDIPPNSVLDFEIEMLDFLPEQVVRQMQMQQQMQGMGGAMPGGVPGGAPGAPPAQPVR